MEYHRKRERGRWTERERKREREGGRMQCFMKQDDKSLIDVENVETTCERCCHHADEHHWTVHCVRSSEWSTSMYIIPMYLRLTPFTKPSLEWHFTYMFCYFISLWGSTRDSADDWTVHTSAAARDSLKRVRDGCKVGWRRPGAPPTKILATPVRVG